MENDNILEEINDKGEKNCLKKADQNVNQVNMINNNYSE